VLQVFFALNNTRAFGSQVTIMKAKVGYRHLAEKLERSVKSFFCRLKPVGTLIPGMGARARTKGIGAVSAKRMPVADRKTQMLGHGLVADHAIRIVSFEC
jgi:hypothetical protein